jgi:hypothetical protein
MDAVARRRGCALLREELAEFGQRFLVFGAIGDLFAADDVLEGGDQHPGALDLDGDRVLLEMSVLRELPPALVRNSEQHVDVTGAGSPRRSPAVA